MLLMNVRCSDSSLIPNSPRLRNWSSSKYKTYEKVKYRVGSNEFNCLFVIPTGFWSLLNILKCHPTITWFTSMDKVQWQLIIHSSKTHHHNSWIQGRIQHKRTKDLCYICRIIHIHFLHYFHFIVLEI